MVLLNSILDDIIIVEDCLRPRPATLILSTMLAARGGPGGNPADPRSSRSYSVEPATDDETKWLVYMREEEKPARDVYQLLYERWNLGAFDRIGPSEQRHFSSIGPLLARFELGDLNQTQYPRATQQQCQSQRIVAHSADSGARRAGFRGEREERFGLQANSDAGGKANPLQRVV